MEALASQDHRDLRIAGVPQDKDLEKKRDGCDSDVAFRMDEEGTHISSVGNVDTTSVTGIDRHREPHPVRSGSPVTCEPSKKTEPAKTEVIPRGMAADTVKVRADASSSNAPRAQSRTEDLGRDVVEGGKNASSKKAHKGLGKKTPEVRRKRKRRRRQERIRKLEHGCSLTLQERAFIPRIVRDQIATDKALPPTPCARPSRGAVLFADVSGFTALGENLRRMFVRRARAKPGDGDDGFGQHHHHHIGESHHRQMQLQMMQMRRLDSSSSLGSLASSHLQHHSSVSVAGEAPMDVGMGSDRHRGDVSCSCSACCLSVLCLCSACSFLC